MAGDFDSPVYLFHQNEADHLMGQGNAPEGYAFIGTAAQGLRKAEGAADDEGQFTRTVEGQVGESL